MSSWVLEQPTRRLLTVKYLPQWQRGLWNPTVQESLLSALTWWLHLCRASVCCLWIFISILILQMEHQQVLVESAGAGLSHSFLSHFSASESCLCPLPSNWCVFQDRPCSSHLLTFLSRLLVPSRLHGTFPCQKHKHELFCLKREPVLSQCFMGEVKWDTADTCELASLVRAFS